MPIRSIRVRSLGATSSRRTPRFMMSSRLHWPSPSGILFIRDHKMANVPADFHSFPGGNDGIMRCHRQGADPSAIQAGRSSPTSINGQIRLEALDRPNTPVRMRPSTTVMSPRA